MQIVIPMSGFGERFRRVGYRVPKPLIEIEGKPIIAHVIDMFPGETDFVFICNEDHLNEPYYGMESILRKYCPTGRILGVKPHKLGPIHAVRQALHLIDPAKPVVVNYCDFTCYWNWPHFKNFVVESRCDGAIPAYKGFHPHTLGTTNYAYMRERDGWVSDIQEKQPYTDNRMQEYASSGTYYFRSGKIMADAFSATMEQDINVGGEYYVSLAYKPLLTAGAPVAVYDLQHFMQWGTPPDVAEYDGWSSAFRSLAKPAAAGRRRRGTIILPMAGLGERFSREGYPITKPLIPVSGKPMVVQATDCLPPAERHAFVLRRDMPGFEAISETLRTSFPGTTVEVVDTVTQGQACTALLGLDALRRETGSDPEGPVTFGACDLGILYDGEKFDAMLGDDADVIVWAARGHSNAVRNPGMYGWIDADCGVIRHVSVKTPLSSPETDPIVIGTFTFRCAADFRRCVERMISRDGRINNEFYLDTCVNDALALGLRCKVFEIDGYLSWGTPNDLRTFEYWQSCFHKWNGHTYVLERDTMTPPGAARALRERYAPTIPAVPSPKS